MHCPPPLATPRRALPLALVLVLALGAAASATAQAPWRSALYPADWTPPTALRFESDKLIQDFSHAGYRGGGTPIPAIAGPIYDAVAFGADPTGAADSTAAIQGAIDAAAAGGGGVVRLSAGVFRLAPRAGSNHALRIAASGIVLRGAGRGRTFLFNDSHAMRGLAIIRVDGSGSGWGTVPAGSPPVAIAEDLLGPTTSIPVASVDGFAVGDWIMLRADATDAFIAEHGMTDLWGGRGGNLGGVMFQRQITAIDPATRRLTIDVPIRYYLKTRDNARVHRAVPHVEEVGLEDFSIGNREHALARSGTGWREEDYDTPGNGSYDAHASWAIALRRVRNSWVSGVASYRPNVNTVDTHLLSNGVLLENCRGVTVRGCDFQRPLFGGGGGNGYMYRLQASNECLVRDSAARHNRHGFVFSHMACSGNVILGGIGQVTRVQAAAPGTTSGEGSDHHMHLSQSNLIDGVQLEQDFFTAHYRGTSGSPPQHGQTAAHSVYWNLVGLAYHSTKTWIVRSEQARYGYAIGTRGPASGITTPASAGARTAPVDHAEGAGLGATLQPLSLYHDQLARRLGRVVPPGAPTALAAAAGVDDLTLTWNPGAGAASYRIFRARSSGGPYTLAGTTGDLRFTDRALTTGATYYYVVSAVNEAGESAAAFEVAARPLPAFQQEAAGDALVVLEAEQHDAQLSQGGHAWLQRDRAGASGDGAMEAAPNTGATRDAGFTSSSPRLDFRVRFARAGTHWVWVRGLAPGGNDDSLHVGLNGLALDSSDRLGGFGADWTWQAATMDGPVATLDVPSAGVHTLNLWMREDGLVVDKLVLTASAAYRPAGPGPSASARVGTLPPAVPAAAAIVNLATRALVGGAAGTPVAGFVLGGAGAKRMLLRAVGPGLAAFGLGNAVPAPTLALVAGPAALAGNEGWSLADTDTFRAVGAFPLTAGSRDAALVATLAAGPYSTPVGANAGSGIALLEIYDAQPGVAGATLVNASTRAYVGTGDAVLIPGFTVAGPGEVRLLVRAVGPALRGFGVDGALADPQLTLYRGAAVIGGNDDWGAAANAAEIATAAARAGAFALPVDSRDAAMLVALPAGSYTATIGGAGATTGTALVELYVVP